jgi:ribosomal protein L7/L12
MTEQTAVLAVLLLCLLLVVGLLGARLNRIEARVAGLASVNAKLDLLLKHTGLEFDLYNNVPSEVVQALQSGRKIEAIKRYREATGVGLKEAKDFVEEVQRRTGVG